MPHRSKQQPPQHLQQQQHGAQAAGAGLPDDDAPEEQQQAQQGQTSVYRLLSEPRKRVILAVTAVASILVPFTDTVYLPALAAVGRDLHADAGLVAASVSIYMFLVGVGSVFWGPLADRYGRRVTYLAASVAFIATSLGCVFAPTISVLVAFRALQGLAVAAYQTTGQGVIADVYAPAVRGTALGLFSVPLLVGPLLGPLLGGVLSGAYGWRSTFIAITVFAGAIILPLLLLLVPETHQHHTLTKLHQSSPDLAKAVVEAPAILASPPVFHLPWRPLGFLLERSLAPFALLTMTSFGSMFASLTTWPAAMGAPPYSLSEAMIGVSYLSMGVAGFIGSPLGGKSSDIAAAAWPHTPSCRLVPSLALSIVLMPAGCLLLGWSLQAGAHIAVPLAGHFLIGVASAAWLPAMFGYTSTVKQANAAAAAAAVHVAMFFSAGTLILVSVPGARWGLGPWFTLLGGVHLAVALAAAACIWASTRRAAGTQPAPPPKAVSLRAFGSRAALLAGGGGGGNSAPDDAATPPPV